MVDLNNTPISLSSTGGRWVRSGTTLSPKVSGDSISVKGTASFGAGETTTALAHTFNSGSDLSIWLAVDTTNEWRFLVDQSGASTGDDAFIIQTTTGTANMIELANDGTAIRLL